MKARDWWSYDFLSPTVSLVYKGTYTCFFYLPTEWGSRSPSDRILCVFILGLSELSPRYSKFGLCSGHFLMESERFRAAVRAVPTKWPLPYVGTYLFYLPTEWGSCSPSDRHLMCVYLETINIHSCFPTHIFLNALLRDVCKSQTSFVWKAFRKN